jgi:hypothetical protein
VYAYEGLTYEFFYYEPHKYADRVQGVLTKMLAAMPADEED